MDRERVEKYSTGERLFPVFALTSTLISVMQRHWNDERKMKALTSQQSVHNNKKKKKHTKKTKPKENIWILSGR